MEMPSLQRFALPTVTFIVLFFTLSSQILFNHIEPGPLRKGEAYLFNTWVVCLLICYWRTCLLDPGKIPKDWYEHLPADIKVAQASQRQRWCRKCESYKPPRAHHCKMCKRCIMKMDHHCVWTANCVSHITFPHFIRFVGYLVISMVYLEYFLFIRCRVLWEKRNLPSYLGPSMLQLGHMFILTVVNSIVLFALLLLLARTIWGMMFNITTIEGWEIERHETLQRRARVLGGYLHGADGSKIRVDGQEFPWDVGIWRNICQAMGTANVIAWIFPLASSPDDKAGLSFEHNGIDDPSKPWPPPDPDRMLRAPRQPLTGDGFTHPMDMDAFRRRQEADHLRYADADGEYVLRRRPYHERLEEMQKQSRDLYADDENAVVSDGESDSGDDQRIRSQGEAKDDAGEEGWRNKEGERLADFGVDEVADFYDEDDVPLAELIRRRKET